MAKVEGRNYLISYDCVCLTLDAEGAIEWAQRANFNNFAVLKIDSSKLNKTFNIIKTLPQEVLEIGKHYISKKFHKELGI